MVSQITTRPSGLLENAPAGRAHPHGHFSWASRAAAVPAEILSEETAMPVRQGEEGQAAREVEEGTRPDRRRLQHQAEQAVVGEDLD